MGKNKSSFNKLNHQERQELLPSAVLDSVGEGIIAVDSSSIIVMINREAEKIWGYSENELVSKNLGLLLPEKSRKPILDGLKKYLKTRSPTILNIKSELEGIRKNGSVFPMEICITETIIEDQMFFTAAVRDITDRKQIEKLLQNSEEFLRKYNSVLVDLSKIEELQSGDFEMAIQKISEVSAKTLNVKRVNIWLYNDDSSVIQCIEQYDLSTNEHSKGYVIDSRDYPDYFRALEEERLIAAHDAHNDPRTREFTEKYLVPNKISSMLDAPIRISGRMVGLICHEHCGVQRNWSAEEQNFVGSVSDFITIAFEANERKQALMALNESQERYRALVENTFDQIYEASTDGKFMYVSSKHKDLFGYDENDFIGKNIFELVHPDDRTNTVNEFNRSVKDYVTGHAVYRYLHKNGSWRWIESSGKPYLTKDGEVRVLIFSRDITDRINAENALKDNLQQLSKKNRYESIVSTVLRSIHKSTNLQEVLDNAVNSISENILRADCVAIYFVEGDELVLQSQRGYKDWYLNRVRRINYPTGYAWKVIIDQNPRYCSDVDTDDVIGPAGRELGIKSYLSMPIQYHSKTIGTININSYEKKAFDEEELKILDIVGEQISVAVGNSKQKGLLQDALKEVEKLHTHIAGENGYYDNSLLTGNKLGSVIGNSRDLIKSLIKAEQAISTNYNLFIYGEKGTGKELLARSIHQQSSRKDYPFIRIDFTRFPAHEHEMAIFGREKIGENSGMMSVDLGGLELANKGTVFLKEICHASLNIQYRILNFINDREFKRNDYSDSIKLDVRIMVSSSTDPVRSLRDKTLLDELYYELNNNEIKMPALREHKEDIPLLANHFITDKSSDLIGKLSDIPHEFFDILKAHNWPGNVKELKKVIYEFFEEDNISAENFKDRFQIYLSQTYS